MWRVWDKWVLVENLLMVQSLKWSDKIRWGVKNWLSLLNEWSLRWDCNKSLLIYKDLPGTIWKYETCKDMYWEAPTVASNEFRSLGWPCTTDFFMISPVSWKCLWRSLMVLGWIPVYSAICMSLRPDCSDIWRAISFSALEMCQCIVGVVGSVISCLPRVQIPTQPVCISRA